MTWSVYVNHSVEGRSRRSNLGWVCGQPGGVHRTPYGCPSSARAERHIHADSRAAVDSRGGDHPLSEEVVEENSRVALRARATETERTSKEAARCTSPLTEEALTASAALV